MREIQNSKKYIFIEIVLFLGGIILFSYFQHATKVRFLFSFIGLLIIATLISRRIHALKDIRDIFQLYTQSQYLVYFIIIGILIGILFGFYYRNYARIDLFPIRITYIAAIASSVGATEELLFRGYLQNQLRKIGRVPSIVFAAVFHTTYKVVFFISRQSLYEGDVLLLAKWTLIVGLIFGILKEYSNNSLPPLFGHAMFDIVSYGDEAISPWWLWT